MFFYSTVGVNGLKFCKYHSTFGGTSMIDDINSVANANGNYANFSLGWWQRIFSAITGAPATGAELCQ